MDRANHPKDTEPGAGPSVSPELARDAESEPPHCAQDRQSRRPGLPGPVTSEHIATASYLLGRRDARWENPTRKTLPASLGCSRAMGSASFPSCSGREAPWATGRSRAT